MNEQSLAVQSAEEQERAAQRAALVAKVEAMVKDKDSRHTRRAYREHIMEFCDFTAKMGSKLDAQAVVDYKAHLREEAHKGTSAINQRLSAVRFFIKKAAAAKLIEREEAREACQIEGVRHEGERTGNWLTKEQAQAIIDAPDTTTALGLRDRAALALLIGAGLRRAEAASLTVKHIRQCEGRWCIVDIKGKRNKVRTIPINARVKALVDDWCSAAGITAGLILRQCSWGKEKFEVLDEGISEQAIYRIVCRYRSSVGNHQLAAHDLRRSFAKLSREGGAALEQIQLNLGHENLDTTRKYLGAELDYKNAPSDYIEF